MTRLQLTTFRLFLILFHYYNYVTDILMMIKYWNEDYMVYFWITLSTAVISWIVCLFILAVNSDNKLQIFLLLIIHLDYPVLLCVKQPMKDSYVGSRKYASTGIQSATALLISVHYLFISQQVTELTLLSIFGSIVDISYTVVLFNLFKEDINQVSLIRSICLIVPPMFITTCQNIFMAITFGFVSALYWPYGAFVSVGYTVLVLVIVLKVKGVELWVSVLISLASNLFLEVNLEDGYQTSAYRIQRLIQFVSSVIAIAVHHDQFSTLITGAEIWLIMAYVACGCFVVWLIRNLCNCFKEIELEEWTENYFNDEEVKGGCEFDLPCLNF